MGIRSGTVTRIGSLFLLPLRHLSGEGSNRSMNTLTYCLAAAAAFLALGAHAAVENTPLLASIEWIEQEGIKLIDGELRKTENTVAWGNFTNMVNATGWSFIEIQTDPKFPDKIQAFAAGYLEGYLSADLIYLFWRNTVENTCNGKDKK